MLSGTLSLTEIEPNLPFHPLVACGSLGAWAWAQSVASYRRRVQLVLASVTQPTPFVIYIADGGVKSASVRADGRAGEMAWWGLHLLSDLSFSAMLRSTVTAIGAMRPHISLHGPKIHGVV